jgi:hypothetical protein
VTRRLEIAFGDPGRLGPGGGRPIRLLAVSDEPDPTLYDESNRAGLGPLGGILGCGDLEPDYLAFLADAFLVPVVAVRGNHDRGGAWNATSSDAAALLQNGDLASIGRLVVGGLGWPGTDHGMARHQEVSAWSDAMRLGSRCTVRRFVGRPTPSIVISHAPPRGLGDQASDTYHRGFRAYNWLLEFLRPAVWIHGHSTPASIAELVIRHGATTIINATGSILIELVPDVGVSG